MMATYLKKILSNKIKKSINESIFLKKKINKFSNEIIFAVNLVSNTLINDGRIFLCGNAGSAADAQHLVRLKKNIQ